MSDDERMPRPPADAKSSASSEATAGEKPRDAEARGRNAAAQPAPAAPATSPPVPPTPRVEPPSPEIALAEEASPLPGAHRGGFRRLPTAPIAVTVQSAPAEPGTEDAPVPVAWTGAEASGMHRGLAGWALAFAVVGLTVSLFVGWGFPIGIVAVVSAILALRRPLESRGVAVWAIAVATVSILYSAGWLLYAAWRANLLG